MTATTAIKNHGMITTINKIDPAMFANVIKNIRNDSEIVSSMVSISFANLFMIRPRGVVSKKFMGARMVESIALRWRYFDALYVRRPTAAPEAREAMVKETPRAA